MTDAEQLSALDSTFLELEQSDSSAHMHIGAVLVFEPVPGHGTPTREQLIRRLAQRIGAMPRFRQRLSDPVIGGLRRPHWIEDPDFDLDNHVSRAALPAPGGDAELLEWAGGFYSQRLDRRLPLWEVAIVEGLQDGRWALATKVHHCLVDGVGSLDLATLFEDGATAETSPRAARRTPHPPAVAQLVMAGLDALRHPRRTVSRTEALAELIVREELVSAPGSSLNQPIGEHRRLYTSSTTLDRIRAVCTAAGGTVNDVVLTAVTTGLREMLLARGEDPPAAGLRAMVPVNVRPRGDGSMGNRISSRFVALPVAEADLERRHTQVKALAGKAKRGHQPAGAATLLELAEHLPPVLHATFARTMFATRLFNVTVTNVPGPQRQIRMFRARLEEIAPIVPIAADHAVGVAVISYAGRLTFCVNADRDSAPDAWRVTSGIDRALEELGAMTVSEVPA